MMKTQTEISALSFFATLFVGAFLGALAKFADLYTQNLGNVFSQMSIWILICVLVATNSKTTLKAALNVFALCAGMLAAYYFTAFVLKAQYSKIYIIGWTVFALFSPIFGASAKFAKGKSVLCKVTAFCIVLFSFLSSAILFDGVRIYDYIINAVLIYFLFFKDQNQA